MMKTLMLVFELLKNRRLSTILLAIEMCICLIILSTLVSQRDYFKKSAGVANTFKDDDVYYFSAATYYFDFSLVDILPDNLKNAIELGSITRLNIPSQMDNIGALAYSPIIEKNLNLNLKSGCSFADSDSKNIKAIGVGDLYKVGDTIVTEKGAVIEVIGTIPMGSYIFSCNSGTSNGGGSLDNFVMEAYGMTLIVEMSNEFDEYVSWYQKGSIIRITDESKREDVLDFITDYGTMSSIAEMTANYKRDIMIDLVSNMLLLTVFSIMTSAGIIAINGIQATKNTKYYAICYMCGMSPVKNMLVEALSSFGIVIVAYALYMVFGKEYYSNKPWLFVYLFALYFISSIIFIIRAARHDLIELYKK